MPYIKTLRNFFAGLILLLPSLVFSQTQEIKEYKVMKGDTLWSISGQELNDHFLWPKVWKENPEIDNPDRLYPGQIIKIPLYLLQKVAKEEEKEPKPEVKPEPVKPKEVAKIKEPEPVRLQPLVPKKLLMGSGYISGAIGGAGRITGSPSGRQLFGNEDYVYVNTISPVKVGDRFYIIRVGELVKHPITGKEMGYMVEIRGVAQIARFEYGQTIAKITEMFNDILTGDLIDTYYELTPPLTTGSFRKPAINGMIVAARNMQIMNSLYDIVYIDKGSKDGIEIGDLLRTVAVGEHSVPNGVIQIINHMDNTATAVVRESSDPVMPGNITAHLE